MMQTSRQNLLKAAVAAVASAAAIATVLSIIGLWSGFRVAGRVRALSQRLDTKDDQAQTQAGEAVKGDKKPELSPGNADAKPGGERAAKPDPVTLALNRIKENHLFMTPPQPDFRAIIGVLGDRVLYPGGVSVGVGENHNGATIKEIGGHWVKVEFGGELITLAVFGEPPPVKQPKKDDAQDDKKPQPQAPDDAGHRGDTSDARDPGATAGP